MVALCQGQPKTLSLKEIIKHFILHRKEIVTRRSIFELQKALKRTHILEGLSVALININLIINLIKNSKNSIEAKKLIIETKWIFENKKNNIQNIIETKKIYQKNPEIGMIIGSGLGSPTHLNTIFNKKKNFN